MDGVEVALTLTGIEEARLTVHTTKLGLAETQDWEDWEKQVLFLLLFLLILFINHSYISRILLISGNIETETGGWVCVAEDMNEATVSDEYQCGFETVVWPRVQ